ncbi:MAG: hypothetical protein ABIG66_02510 [Candidatus Kerfeldbacteria bacterium]
MATPATTLQEAAYRTIVYFDMFDFAPTLLEIEKWMLHHGQGPSSLSFLKKTIESDERISHKDGFYFLRGDEELTRARLKRYDYTDEKWKHARPYIKLLAMMPHVRAIWLANAMGWGNARENSDIDLFIVTTPGKIWSARFFTTALLKLLRQRPFETEDRKAICLSMYAAENALNMEPYKIAENDIHFSFWAAQFYPVYDSGSYLMYKDSNRWLNDVFEHLYWTEPARRRMVRLPIAMRIIKGLLSLFALERLLKMVQLAIMPLTLKDMANKDNRVVTNDQILKLHTNDKRAEQQRIYEQRIA